MSLFLLPVLVLAFPTLYSLQFGQFHLATLVLSVAAMLLFERDRNVVGGSLAPLLLDHGCLAIHS